MKMHSAIPLIIIQSPFRVDYKQFSYEPVAATCCLYVHTLGQLKFWMAGYMKFVILKEFIFWVRLFILKNTHKHK